MLKDLDDLKDSLARDGFVYLQGLCDRDFTESVLRISLRRIRDVKAALGDREIGIGSAAGFDEIVQRSPGRWDVPISPEDLGTRDRDLPWWPLVSATLGADAEHSFSGVVFSKPGSPAQCWHIDSPHTDARHREPHALNVMVALHDIPREMGPTEIAVGSHSLTNHLANPSLVHDELVYQHAGTTPALLVEGTGEAVPGVRGDALDAGSCILFDDRILHRGLQNRSRRTRYVAYFSYRKKAYRENTHFEAGRSVFDPPPRHSPGG